MSSSAIEALDPARVATTASQSHSWAARLIADGTVAAVLALWWLAAQHYGPVILPSPLAVARDFISLFVRIDSLTPTLGDESLWHIINLDGLRHIGASTLRVILSVLIALFLGGGLALLARGLPMLYDVVHGRILIFLNSFPSVGWAILSVIWFQVSNFSVVFVQVAILIPFCLVNIAEGLAELDREILEMAKSFTRRRLRVFIKVMLPLMLPFLVAALRISYGIAWKIALISELFGADSGLGYLMYRAEQFSDAPRVFSTSLAVVLLFTLGDKLAIEPLARRFARNQGKPS